MPTEEDLSYMNPALAVEAQRLAQRKEALKQQALDASRQLGSGPQGQMVGNGGFQHYVPPHWSQQAAPVVSTALNRLDQRQLDSDTAAFDQREQAAAKAHMARMPVTRSEPGPYGVAVTVEPTDQERLQWAQQGMLIPSLAPTMKAYLDDQLIKAPERSEARQARKDLQATALADKQEARQQQLDFQRWQTGENNAIRRDIANMKGGSGGPKASDYRLQTDAEGNTWRINLLTKETENLGKLGKGSAAGEKAQADATQAQSNAQDALDTLERMKPYFDKATQSEYRSVIEREYTKATGESTDAAAALKSLGIEAANLNKFADRKMFGPQFTDADVKAIKESMGNFEKATSYKERMAAYNTLREIFQRQLGQPTRQASGKVGGSLSSYQEPKFSAQQREQFGQQLMEEWKAAKPSERGAIEQRALSSGATFNGRPYKGGAFSSREAWGDK